MMFILSQCILHKSNVSNVSTYSIALGLVLYSCIYLYVLFYNPESISIFNKFIIYIVGVDLLLSTFYYNMNRIESEEIQSEKTPLLDKNVEETKSDSDDSSESIYDDAESDAESDADDFDAEDFEDAEDIELENVKENVKEIVKEIVKDDLDIYLQSPCLDNEIKDEKLIIKDEIIKDEIIKDDIIIDIKDDIIIDIKDDIVVEIEKEKVPKSKKNKSQRGRPSKQTEP